MKRRFPASLAALLLPALGWAQPAGVATSPSSVVATWSSSSGADFSDGLRRFNNVDVAQASFAASTRVWQQAATSVSLEASYERYDFDVDSRFVPLPESAHAFGLQAALRRPLNQDWTFLGQVKGSVATSGSGFSRDGLGATVMLLGLRQQSATFTWAFGLLYRSLAEDDYRFLPALGFNWRPNQTWSAAVGFPRSGVTYAITPQLDASLAATFHGGTFHVRDAVGSALSSLPPIRDTLLDYTEIRVGAGLTWRPSAGLELGAAAGLIVHQEFDYFDRGYDLDSRGSAPFFHLTAKFAF